MTNFPYRLLVFVAFAAVVLAGGASRESRAAIMLSEIMYDPQNADANREWVEVYNYGSSPIDMSGWQFGLPQLNQWSSAFPSGTVLGSGQALVVTPSAATLNSDWGGGINRLQVGNFPALTNTPNDNISAATIAVRNGSNVIQDMVSYRNGLGWGTSNGNDGNSIYVLPQGLNTSANDTGGNWKPSSQGVYGAYWRGAGGDSENHASPGFVAANVQAPFEPSPDAVWSMVILPDTQNYSARPNETHIFHGQTNWIKANKDLFNIQAVLHEGDIVNRNSGTAGNGVTGAQQWANAQSAMHVLNDEVPYIMAVGNHDLGVTNSQTRDTKFNDYFKATDNDLVNPATGGILKGQMTPGRLENAYYEFTAPDGREMLIFSLEFWPRQQAIDWANSIASEPQYADHTAVLLTHSYIGSANQRWDVGPNAYGMGPDGNDGVEMWNELVKVNGNFEMTFNGHIGGDQVGYRVDQNNAGVDVHQMLLNAQFETNAGNGWLRVVEFLEDGETVRVRTYSPHFDLYRTNAANQFNITLTHLQAPLVWNEGAAAFSDGFARSDGELGIGVTNADPFGAGGKEDLLIGNYGVATLSGSSSSTAGSLAVGTNQASSFVAGRNGNGTIHAVGSRSITLGNSQSTGDLTVGEGGFTGEINWSSTGTLEVQGKLRVGQGGTGTISQNDGVIIGGNTAGNFKFLAFGVGTGGQGIYNLNNGVLRPSGGFNGTEFRQTAVGDAGGNGELNVGDGVGAAGSAAVETNDDLLIGRSGGFGIMRIRSDGRIELRTNTNQSELRIGQASTGVVLQTGGVVTSDSLVQIGSAASGFGNYTISAGSLTTATDGLGTFQIGNDGGNGTLRVEGTASVSHGAELFVGDGTGSGASGRLEIVGSTASVEIGQLENAAGGTGGVHETARWVADAGGITPLVITGAGPLASHRVQLQDPTEVASNSGTNGNGDLSGDGIALELDLSVITTSMALTLIDNRTPEAVTGFFENGQTTDLYEEGEVIDGTGFNGIVTISYAGGTGNDVWLNLVAAPGVVGDYNGDGMVDAADYVVWRKTGINGQQGYDDWRANYGATGAPGAGAARGNRQVPEPAAGILVLLQVLVFLFTRGRMQ
jgi:Lamin Tail Domain/Calcineurin-like phosphoesterase